MPKPVLRSDFEKKEHVIMDNDVIILPAAPSFPFVRFKPVTKYVVGVRSGKDYYFHDAAGVSVRIGTSMDRGTGHLVYAIDDEFLREYENVLPIGNFRSTECYREFEDWAYQQIYFSFLTLSEPQNEIRWFVKTWYNMRHWRDQVLFPEGSIVQPLMNSWILIKVGIKVFPIHITRTGYHGDWGRFMAKLDAIDGFKLICGFERTWILDVIALNKELDVVHPEWFDTGFERRFSRFPGGGIVLGSSIEPKLWARQDFRTCFGHVYVDAMVLAEDLGRRLAVFADEGARYQEIMIVGCGREVLINKSDGGFSVHCLQKFETVFNLKVNYLLYFGVVSPGLLFVLVFDEHGRDGGLLQDG